MRQKGLVTVLNPLGKKQRPTKGTLPLFVCLVYHLNLLQRLPKQLDKLMNE